MSTGPLSPTSRYAAVEIAKLVTADGTEIAYLRRRFIAGPERFDEIQTHTVQAHERLDHITAQYLGDPEQFWRLCDANGVMRAEELEVVGRLVRITLPEGIPGPRGMDGNE